MAQFEQHFVQDLTQQIKVRHCGSIVFNADNESNVVSVSLFNGSEPVAISGSVVGSVICPDGATVPLTGSYSGNTASVTLTGDCFAVLGQISVGIQIVNGTQKITVLKAYYDVEALTTENVVDPGSRITLEVGDLIDDIETAVASIPADYSDLLAAIAPNYSGLTFPVKAGTFCWYNGTLYQAQQDIATSEAWTAAHWASSVLTTSLDEKLADVDDELGDLKIATEALFDMQDFSQNVYFTMTDGEIHSGTQQADARRCYSNLINNVLGMNIYFDDTKYKALLVYFNESQTDHTFDSWVSASPVTSQVLASNYSKLCIELQTKNDSNINKADAQATTYYIVTEENKIKRALGTVYVSGLSGNDNNDGSSANPYKTIEKAISSGAKEILIYTTGYAYDEPIVLTNINGLRIAPVISSYYPAYGTNTPKIVVSGGNGYSLDHAIEMTNCQNITLEGFDCHNIKEAIVKIENCFNFKIIDSIFYENANSGGGSTRDGLQIENGSGEVINCRAWNIGRDGFNIHGYGCTRFIDCVAYNCGDDGISHHDACTGTISGGEFYNCGKGGVSSPTHGAYIDVDGVYSHDNAYGLYAVTADETVRRRVKGIIRNCVFKDNSSYDIAVISGDLVGIQNIYDTKSISISTQATFTEFN